MTDVKICGIRHQNHLDCAAKSGARYIGLVFYPNSPRFIDPEMARILARSAPTGVRLVGLFVNPDNAFLDKVLSSVPLDMVQLHGSEPPVRVMEIKSTHTLPVIKAIPVAKDKDLQDVDEYSQVADWLLFDAKVTRTNDSFSSPLPGGNGVSFDWTILKNRRFSRPWMLSGGLHKGNVGDALSILNPDAVDVSSGVEASVGEKDSSKISEFIQIVRQS
ncbi:MAG TPA: phosphoribosylanthranilate isomerase [Alphaproteobacteria bacterium]|nr:phosphoribosylanthranilate isomerase [Alphaproteobacteria bacterium]HOO52207.1 phosphoribosylanthranilate isomerase [Alphaproteobacteria bacterium]